MFSLDFIRTCFGRVLRPGCLNIEILDTSITGDAGRLQNFVVLLRHYFYCDDDFRITPN